jgi:CO/xanthine dehydrogenase Mo-binding subunit
MACQPKATAVFQSPYRYRHGKAVAHVHARQLPAANRGMPEVETIVLPSGGFRSGVLDLTIAATAPAVLSAIYPGLDQRIRQVPLKKPSSVRHAGERRLVARD